MQVIIDGVPYGPVSASSSRIGIAITTHNRPDILKKALEQHRKFLPPDAVLVVIDDGSKPSAIVPDGVRLIRHESSLGIVAAKNSSLVALMDAGCEHLFLWDDDAYPIADNWYEPYVESPEPHLAYQFLDLAGPRKLNDMTELYRDDKHVAYTGQRGVMLYYHRRAIEKVGGFDPVYGRGMYEHPDLARRIHCAGLTTWPFGDVVGSEKLIYSSDEHEAVNRSIPTAERRALVERNVYIHNQRRDSFFSGYVEYRQKRNAVITTLLTTENDPQRSGKMSSSPEMLRAWCDSIKGAEKIVLADELSDCQGAKVIRVAPAKGICPYFARWQRIFEYLRANEDIGLVWCTDGTDVEMLREPWSKMDPGVVYVGDEHTTYDNPWFAKVNSAQLFTDFIKENASSQVLNAGLIGGSRENVMKVAHRIISIYWHILSKNFWDKNNQPGPQSDMIAFAISLRDTGVNVSHGPHVNTVFKTEGHGKELAFWKHK